MPPFLTRSINSLLKLFFYLLYHPFAWAYDFIADLVSVGKWKDWVLIASRYVVDSPVLEIGHGPGHLQIDLAKTTKRIHGLDSSWQMSRQAHRRLMHARLPIRLVNGRSQALPFSDNAFASVVATFPTEYISDPHTLKEIWRILKPGGRLIVVPLAWITGNSLHERWAAWLFRWTKQSPQTPPMRSEAKEWDIYFDHSGKSLVDRFQEAGFLTDVQIVNLLSSELMLILAEKSSGDQSQEIADPDS